MNKCLFYSLAEEISLGQKSTSGTAQLLGILQTARQKRSWTQGCNLVGEGHATQKNSKVSSCRGNREWRNWGRLLQKKERTSQSCVTHERVAGRRHGVESGESEESQVGPWAQKLGSTNKTQVYSYHFYSLKFNWQIPAATIHILPKKDRDWVNCQ